MGSLITETPYSEITATLELLSHLGVTRQHLERLRADPAYAQRVAGGMLRDGLEGPVDPVDAAAILGHNFFGSRDWTTCYGVTFTPDQLQAVGQFPWGEDVLNRPCPFVKGKRVKDTHFAFLGLDRVNGEALTIQRWHKIHQSFFTERFYWYKETSFATQSTCGFRYYLMPLEVVVDSAMRTVEDVQQSWRFPKEYEVPSAVEEATKLLLYLRKHSIHLCTGYLNLVSDTVREREHVSVGILLGSSIVIYGSTGWMRGNVGVAFSRKPGC